MGQNQTTPLAVDTILTRQVDGVAQNTVIIQVITSTTALAVQAPVSFTCRKCKQSKTDGIRVRQCPCCFLCMMCSSVSSSDVLECAQCHSTSKMVHAFNDTSSFCSVPFCSNTTGKIKQCLHCSKHKKGVIYGGGCGFHGDGNDSPDP
jgi:hypothetical protein